MFSMKRRFPRSFSLSKWGKTDFENREIFDFSDFPIIFYRKALLREISSELVSFRVFWPEIDCSGGARCKPRESKETRAVAQTMPESAQHFQNVLSNVL